MDIDTILQGVYDETTTLIDSLKNGRKKNSEVLELIKSDELGKAIEAITSPEYNVPFARRLNQLERESRAGTLSVDEKNRQRNQLAKDLVEHFTSDIWEGRHKL